MATCLGVFLVLSPLAVLPTVGVFIAMTFLTRTISVASISAAAAFPLMIWWLGQVTLVQLSAILGCSAAVIWTHRSNIVRILEGRENRLW